MPKDPFASMLAGGMENEPEPMQLPMPRIFRIRVSESPNGQMVMPGHPVSLRLSGTVKMVDDEGDILVNVTRVEGYGEQKKAEENPNVIYKPVESPSIS